MIVNEETCSPIIERLLLAMVDNRRAVFLEANVLPGRVNWSFRVDVDDNGKIIGMDGVHLRAIQLVIELMGKGIGEQWVGNALDPLESHRNAPRRASTPETHSTVEDVRLLNELLVGLGVSAFVSQQGNLAEGYTFQIAPSRHQDHHALLDLHEAIYRRNQKSRDPLNLIGALGTLFRSIGRRQGVRYKTGVPG